MIITIDGPSGSGKTTIARDVAAALHFAYLDTGALYRAIAYTFLSQSIDYSDEKAVEQALKSIILKIQSVNSHPHYFVNNTDVTEHIRTQEVAGVASIISAYPKVRAFLLPVQRNFAANNNIVCEGRDMGTTVFPEAKSKFFLTARPEVRAQRRFQELQPTDLTLKQLQQEIDERDRRDRSRLHSPLKQPEEAIVIDTSHLSIQEVVNTVLNIVRGPHWEHFAHQADIGIRGIGRTIEEAFEQAAVALTAVITPPDQVQAKKEISFSCEAPDREMLLVEWLNRIIFEMQTSNMLFSCFHVSVHDHTLSATISGEKVDIKKHQPGVEIKAATYNSLAVHCQENLYTAQCVVDV